MTENHQTALLRKTDCPFTLRSFEEDREAMTRLCSQADQVLRIFSHHLNSEIFNNSSLIETVAAFARKNSHTSIQLLITDVRKTTSVKHPFLDLARLYTSSFECRKAHKNYSQHAEEFLLADRCGYIRFPRSGHFEAITNFHDPVKVRELGNFFQEVWDCSEADPELISFRI